MKFTDDMNAPLPAKAMEQPVVVETAAEVTLEVHEVDNEPAPGPRKPKSTGTTRKDADGSQGPWVNLYGQIVHERPNILRPTKPAGTTEAPTKPDPSTRTPGRDTGEGFGTYRCSEGRVQNLRTGAYEDGTMEQQMGGFGTLVSKMSSR